MSRAAFLVRNSGNRHQSQLPMPLTATFLKFTFKHFCLKRVVIFFHWVLRQGHGIAATLHFVGCSIWCVMELEVAGREAVQMWSPGWSGMVAKNLPSFLLKISLPSQPSYSLYFWGGGLTVMLPFLRHHCAGESSSLEGSLKGIGVQHISLLSSFLLLVQYCRMGGICLRWWCYMALKNCPCVDNHVSSHPPFC